MSTISCGGPLDSEKGIVMSPPNLPGWDNVSLVDILYKHFNIPIGIQNDANACALAEWKFGAGKGYRNVIFLTFGTGMGSGLILNGALYSGTNDNAGEVGHIRLSAFGPVGYGKIGSFEGFCSGSGIQSSNPLLRQDTRDPYKGTSYSGRINRSYLRSFCLLYVVFLEISFMQDSWR